MTAKSRESEFNELREIARKRRIGGLERHIFLCIGPECCSATQGEEAWRHLKSRISELGLSASVYRTKVGCLRVCKSGPIAVVYPEGTWYQGLTPAALDRVIEGHLRDGIPVEELAFASNALVPR